MTKKKQIDPVQRIENFQHAVLAQKPSPEDMIHEVRMMNFKVHPVTGDIADLDFSNSEFIDALWSLGKLDEFFRAEFFQMKNHDQDVFYRLIEDMRTNFQQKLNKANIAAIEFKERPKRMFEIEIIKDTNWKIH
ncbi:hypothetical protein KBD81_05375 [Candidatus Woesebacteria bacterium]|nr:hypothetical protein [Candidatus Woesebacteria bacterium]